jgi:hypothetical protein
MYGGNYEGTGGSTGDLYVSCEMCGNFQVTRQVRDDYLIQIAPNKLTTPQRSRLTHQLRVSGSGVKLTKSVIKRFLEDSSHGPKRSEQATNIVRVIGDRVSPSGEPLEALPKDLYAVAGSPSPRAAARIVKELFERGLIRGIPDDSGDSFDLREADLTLSGWEAYEEAQSGRTSGRYGFIALKFNDPILDPFVLNVVKPACAELGYTLVDMRDVKEAGIIDNLMRARIRDAAFVLADLTHDNPGAYWEAGFAEGLGKPVIYLCERSKHAKGNTHFDTNHSTTVIWEESNPRAFTADLVATLRKSLNLFAAPSRELVRP